MAAGWWKVGIHLYTNISPQTQMIYMRDQTSALSSYFLGVIVSIQILKGDAAAINSELNFLPDLHF